MNATIPSSPPPTQSPHVTDPAAVNRRGFLEKLCIGLGAVCGAILAVPVVGFVVAPLFRKAPKQWVNVGKVEDFVLGKTVNVTITDPSSLPRAGISARRAVWLRRAGENEFIAFSVHCTHLGCPARAGTHLHRRQAHQKRPHHAHHQRRRQHARPQQFLETGRTRCPRRLPPIAQTAGLDRDACDNPTLDGVPPSALTWGI